MGYGSAGSTAVSAWRQPPFGNVPAGRGGHTQLLGLPVAMGNTSWSPRALHTSKECSSTGRYKPTVGNQNKTQKMQLGCLCAHWGDKFPSSVSVGTSGPKTQVMAEVCAVEKWGYHLSHPRGAPLQAVTPGSLIFGNVSFWFPETNFAWFTHFAVPH